MSGPHFDVLEMQLAGLASKKSTRTSARSSTSICIENAQRLIRGGVTHTAGFCLTFKITFATAAVTDRRGQ